MGQFSGAIAGPVSGACAHTHRKFTFNGRSADVFESDDEAGRPMTGVRDHVLLRIFPAAFSQAGERGAFSEPLPESSYLSPAPGKVSEIVIFSSTEEVVIKIYRVLLFSFSCRCRRYCSEEGK